MQLPGTSSPSQRQKEEPAVHARDPEDAGTTLEQTTKATATPSDQEESACMPQTCSDVNKKNLQGENLQSQTGNSKNPPGSS